VFQQTLPLSYFANGTDKQELKVSIFDSDDSSGKVSKKDSIGDSIATIAQLLAAPSGAAIELPIIKDGKNNKDAIFKLSLAP
jgi:hypothetical protein